MAAEEAAGGHGGGREGRAESRYARQMLIADLGAEGQARLGAGHAVIVGVGALGCASAEMLARAGVGRLTLIDRDVVEETNLQRQMLFDEADARAGTPKAVAAAARLGRINSAVEVVARVDDLTALNAEELLGGRTARVNAAEREKGVGGAGAGRTVIVDGTDNFATRYVLNDYAVKHGVAYVYGGVVGTRGMQMTVVPGRGACLRCVFAEMAEAGSTETCETAGVLGPAVMIVAGAQSAEALKVLLGLEERLSGSLLEFDVWENRRRRLDLREQRDPACVCCGQRRFEFLEGGAGQGAGEETVLCGRDAVQVKPARRARVDLAALAERLARVGSATATGHVVRAKVGGVELTVFSDGRAIVKGVKDAAGARSAYAKWVGG